MPVSRPGPPEPRLSTVGSSVCTADWLALREPADAAARSPALAERLRRALSGANISSPAGPLIVHDLGCGTGSMGRWLAPRLAVPGTPRRQHWLLHDRDAATLARAATSLPGGVATSVRPGDLARLDLVRDGGPAVVVASALLDVLTAPVAARIAEQAVAAGAPTLLTLSVVGQVSFDPVHPLDAVLAAAFDAHQRRRGLLGPDAVAVTAREFRRRGARTLTAASPWRLGPDRAELTAEWLRGWVGAACAQLPRLTPRAADHLGLRLDQLAAGRLRVTVGHADLLAIPGEGT